MAKFRNCYYKWKPNDILHWALSLSLSHKEKQTISNVYLAVSDPASSRGCCLGGVQGGGVSDCVCDGHEWEVVWRKTAGCGHLGRHHQLSGEGVGEI